MLYHKDITDRILRCAFNVHSALGPGLLESAYENCLHFEMIENGLVVEKQKPLPLVYKEVKLEMGYRMDFVIERDIIVEVKAVEALNEIHDAQLLTYLHLSGCKVGLLINFNVKSLKDGIRRFAN